MPGFLDHFTISAMNQNGENIPPHYTGGYYSSDYGDLEVAQDICFETNGNKITTYIKEKNKVQAN